MFQELVMTGLTPLSNINEIQNWDNRPFNGKWPENQRISVRGSDIKKLIRKKPKRVRTAYSTNQLRALEKIYSTSKYIDAKRRKQLADTLNIGDKALKIWFQNRRMKEKKESSESSCDTSSEIASCQSPTLTHEFVEQKVDVNVPYSNYNDTYEHSQYQLPSIYHPEGLARPHYQHGYSYDYNVASFGVETSVYPTQYYPVENQFNNINTYGHIQNAYEVDTWNAKAFDFNYFNTQQAYS